VRIHETRREHPSTTVDAFRIRTSALELVRRRHPRHSISDNEDAHVAPHGRVGHFPSAARARWAGARHDLGGVVEQEGAHVGTARPQVVEAAEDGEGITAAFTSMPSASSTTTTT
jgi:hypothetical protein